MCKETVWQKLYIMTARSFCEIPESEILNLDRHQSRGVTANPDNRKHTSPALVDCEHSLYTMEIEL